MNFKLIVIKNMQINMILLRVLNSWKPKLEQFKKVTIEEVKEEIIGYRLKSLLIAMYVLLVKQI